MSHSPALSTILAASLLLAAATAQAPNLAPAKTLPGPALVGASPDSQQNAAMARGGASTLLVFEDTRAGDTDLFGVRLDAAGAPIDPVPFAIAKDPGEQTIPKVAWNGQSWLVVYKNQVPTPAGYFGYQVAARRVSAQGAPLDAAPIVVSYDDTGGAFAVTSDGNNWAVSYAGYSAGNSAMLAKRIAPDGTVLDPNGVEVVPSTYYVFFGLTAAFVGNEYVFGFDDNGFRVRRFSTHLTAIDPAPVTILPNAGAIAAVGNQFFVAYPRQTPLFTQEIVGTRFDASLAKLDANPISISGSAPNVNHTDPRAVWDGSQWIVSWFSAGQLTARSARVSAAGATLDFGGITIPDGSPDYLYAPALGALAGGGALFAWHDYRNTATDVFGVPFFANASFGIERLYSVSAEAQLSPRVAAGPEQSLVTFRAASSTGARILAQRLDSMGNPIDAVPIEVRAANHLNLFAGGAAWNGTVYLLAWSDTTQGKIFARRMLPDGTFVDPAPIFVLLGGSADVGALGNDFLVTGLRAPGNPQFVYSYGARVRGSDGALLDNPALLIGQSFATRARIAALGGKWLVATESHVSHDENPASILLNFVDAAGVVSPSTSAGSLNIQNWGIVDVASSGTSALVVAQTGSNWTNVEIHARRILPNGTMPSPMFVLTGGDPGGQSRPTVAWTGAEYVVAYESLQNNSWFYDYEPDIYGVRVSEAGALLDANGFALWNGEDYERAPHVRSLGNGRALFAAATYLDGGYGSFRVSTRAMRPAGLTNYGTGSAGCAGPQRMDANQAPKIGAAGFAFLCGAAPAGQLGLALVTDAQDVAGSDPFQLGIPLHVDVGSALELYALDMVTGAGTMGAAPVAIPNNPLLVGKHYYAQAIWAWGATCALPPFGLSCSDGLELVIQP